MDEVDDNDATLHEYLDFAYCEPRDRNAAAGTSSEGDDTSVYWYCQMYLRNESHEADGYPAM